MGKRRSSCFESVLGNGNPSKPRVYSETESFEKIRSSQNEWRHRRLREDAANGGFHLANPES